MRNKRKRNVLIAIVVIAICLAPILSGAWVLEWADEYIIGSSWIDLKGNNDTNHAIHNEFNGAHRSWSNIGKQYVPNQANAVTMLGAFMRDRTTSDCATLWTSISRSRYGDSGVYHSIGDTCPPNLYLWHTSDGYAERYKDTCDWGNSGLYVPSRHLKADHSSSTYLSEEDELYNWEYFVKTLSYASDDGNELPEVGYNCYNILWFND